MPETTLPPTPAERLAAARAALASPSAKRSAKPATLVTVAGVEVEIRTPSLTKQQAILRASGATAKDAKDTDWAKARAVALVELAYLPGTDLRLLESADIAGILTADAGSEIDEAANAAVAKLNVSRAPGPDTLQAAIGAFLDAHDAEDIDATEAAIAKLREVHASGKA